MLVVVVVVGVCRKVAALRKEKDELLGRVEELEGTLRIVQTGNARLLSSVGIYVRFHKLSSGIGIRVEV